MFNKKAKQVLKPRPSFPKEIFKKENDKVEGKKDVVTKQSKRKKKNEIVETPIVVEETIENNEIQNEK